MHGHHSTRFSLVAAALLLSLQAPSLLAQENLAPLPTTPPADRDGINCVSTKDYPVPAGDTVIPESVCDFEGGKLPPGWGGNGEIKTADDAPQGKSYYQFLAKKGHNLDGPTLKIEGGKPYFLSYWLKSSGEPWTHLEYSSDEREPSYIGLFDILGEFTGDQWRCLGFYFQAPAQCKTVKFGIYPRDDISGDPYVAIDNIQIRTATPAEFSAAYQAERSHLPAYNPTPQPDDGKNLPLVIAKLEGKAGLPGKPFVVWALGSSFTAAQGNGFELMEYIKQHFPHASPVIYRFHGGPGTPWEYTYCWMRQFVDYEQPDLVFSYTSGTAEGLENFLHDIRSRTTAEIIIPTLHQRPPFGPDDVEKGMGDWAMARATSAKHNVEFVENRRELADYIKTNNLVPDDLLRDHNHQNFHGQIRIWDNITRHLVENAQPTYAPETLERTVPVAPPASTATEKVSVTGSWTSADGAIHSTAAGDKVKITFNGNQIYVIGRSGSNGGSVKVTVDGVPGDQAQFFVSNYIQASDRQWRIPHLADLGDASKIVPQNWVIQMTSDKGDFSLTGSVTSADGTGNLTNPFTSTSGQISLDPKNWRQGHVTPARAGFPEYAVQNGDKFTWDVTRSTPAEVSFKADTDSQLVEPLARNLLPNGPHTIELTTTGGDVTINSFYVYQPPEKN
jgi:hypothetical protein